MLLLSFFFQVGSIYPWAESIALALGATRCTTMEYQTPPTEHEALEMVHVNDMEVGRAQCHHLRIV